MADFLDAEVWIADSFPVAMEDPDPDPFPQAIAAVAPPALGDPSKVQAAH